MSVTGGGCQTVTVGTTLERMAIADEAASVADAASASAGVRVAELKSLEHLAAAATLFDTVWSQDNGSHMPLGLLRAISFSENYVAGAFSGEELIGAVSGFRGGSAEEPHLHSHILGVLPDGRSRTVGYALKHHQRAWALAHGLTSIVWTFDPLVAKNAYFNLTKLGAGAGNYMTNFYGKMDDAQNFGEESDRLVVHWRLESPKAITASRGEPMAPNIEDLVSAGAAVVLDQDHRGYPTLNDSRDSILLFKLPSDIVKLRRDDPALGREWRVALRESFGAVLATGDYDISGAARSGCYVLHRS